MKFNWQGFKRKQKISSLVLVTILLAVGYLFLAHHLIYYKLRLANLSSADHQQSYMIGNNVTTGNNTVYAAVGDSLTSGVGAEKYQEAYPYLLAQKISAQNKDNLNLKNFSYPGARTADLIKDLLSPAIASKPDIVTLLIGTNDIHGNVGAVTFKKNYQFILERLTKETSAKIYLISIPFIGSDSLLLPPYDYYYSQKVLVYNEIIKSLAVNYNLTYIDIATPTREELRKDGPHYSADLFHPSAKGYLEWAQIIYDHLN